MDWYIWFAFGVVLGRFIIDLIDNKKRPISGTMHIDSSDPNKLRCVLEIDKDPDEFKNCNQIRIKIDNKAAIPPMEFGDDDTILYDEQ